MGREACCFLHYPGSGAEKRGQHFPPSAPTADLVLLWARWPAGDRDRDFELLLLKSGPRLDPPSSLFLIFLPSWASSLSPGTQSCPKEIHSTRQSHSINPLLTLLPSPSICVPEILRRAVHRTWLANAMLPIGRSVRIPSSCH